MIFPTGLVRRNRHGYTFYAPAALLLSAIIVLSGCRTSQQARRSDSAAQRSATANRGNDSLILVQQKLLNLIDTLSNVVGRDEARIKQLEAEVARLRSILGQPPPMPAGARGVPQTVPQTIPSMPIPGTVGYNAPPSSAIVPGSQVPAPARSVTGALGSAASNAPAATVSPTSAMTSAYTAALQAFNDGRYDESLKRFQDLRTSDASSSYASNYSYWEGESFYALGQYRNAIKAFERVLTLYPGSPKSDDAQFKIAESYEKLGDRERASNAYHYLEMNYPNSEYLQRAEARLRKLR